MLCSEVAYLLNLLLLCAVQNEVPRLLLLALQPPRASEHGFCCTAFAQDLACQQHITVMLLCSDEELQITC